MAARVLPLAHLLLTDCDVHHLVRVRQSCPVDRFRTLDDQVSGIQTVGEDDEIGAAPPGAWHEERIEAEKVGRVTDLLGPAVEQFCVTGPLDSESFEGAKVGNPQRPGGMDGDPMQHGPELRREHRLPAQVEVYLRERAVAFERRVEDVERSGVPASTSPIALQGIAALADDAPDDGVERLTLTCVDRIEQFLVTRFA